MNQGDVTNLWATRSDIRSTSPSLPTPLFCFAGHLDVVPTGPAEQWLSAPFTPTEREGFLYGRGAADMKASIATMLRAVERFIETTPLYAGTLAFLFTSDEEGPALHGTRHVVEILKQRGIHIDYCLVGEPTCEKQLGDTIKNGRRGSLSGILKVLGTQGHIAYPQLADNPIHRLAPALLELTQTEWDTGNTFFPPTSFQISNIHSGTGVKNVIPSFLELMFNFRHSTASSSESLRERFENILIRHHVRYELQWGSSIPFLSKPAYLAEVLSEAIVSVTGIHPQFSTTGGTSDARFIFSICSELLEFGPVNESIHKIDECIQISDIQPLEDIYYSLIQRLLHTTPVLE
jgi:succinyl-diaminopimelate desuccinylase